MEHKYNGRYLDVYEENIGGKIYEKAFIRDSTVTIPFISEDTILMIKEERPSEDPKIKIKFITGFIEKGETPRQNAEKEIQEEIGKKAGKLIEYGIDKKTGIKNYKAHYFLAFDLSDSKLPHDDGENILEIIPMKIDDAYNMVMETDYPISTHSFMIARLYHDIRIKKRKLH